MDALTFRPATPLDLDFLVMAVRIAERVPRGEDRSMYESIFGLTRAELDDFLTGALSREGADFPLTFSTFFVLARGETPVACCSTWVEAAHGVPSGIHLATAISRFIGAKRWKARAPSIRELSGSAPRRTPQAMQFESFYTDPAIRGRGAPSRLIQRILKRRAAEGPLPPSAEITLLAENASAARAYAKVGFEVAWRTPTPSALFEELTGSRGFVQVRRALDRPNDAAHFPRADAAQ